MKQEQKVVRKKAVNGDAPKLRPFDPADPFGLVARSTSKKEYTELGLDLEVVCAQRSADVNAIQSKSPPATPEVQTTILDNDHEGGHLNMPRQLVVEALERIRQERSPVAQRYATTQAGDDERQPEPGFACALWSDGKLQLVRDGNTVVTLTREEVGHVSKYLRRTSLEAV